MIGANPRAVILLPHAQGNTLNVAALFHEQRRGHRAIDTAAHGDDNSLLLSHPISIHPFNLTTPRTVLRLESAV
jgi:hypothetical protein